MTDEKQAATERDVNCQSVGNGDDAAVAGLTGDDEMLRAALEGRAAFYDLLSSLYFRPLKADQIENIAAMDMSSYAEVSELFAEGLHDMSRHLAKRNTGTRQELAVDFTSAFAGTSSWKGKYAVPYESVFTSEEGLLFQDAYHEVYRLYRDNHVERGQGYDYPDDHISFMFEFLAIMSQRAADMVRGGNRAGSVDALMLSKEFLEKHILTWFDAFQDLALLILKTRFYRGVLKVTKGFMIFDVELLDDAIADLKG